MRKHWPNAPIISDIRDYTHDGTNIDILTGGFPCQPFSCAGQRRGSADNRHLWPEMLRVIQEVHPGWIIAENVRNIVNIENGMVFESVCAGLENEGYEVQSFIISACAVGAPHRRDRVWIVAHSKRAKCISFRNTRRRRDGFADHNRVAADSQSEQAQPAKPGRFYAEPGGKNSNGRNPDKFHGNHGGHGSSKISQFESPEIFASNHDTDSYYERFQGRGELEQQNPERATKAGMRYDIAGFDRTAWDEPWLEAATRLCGIFNGLSEWMDRNGGLNAKTSNAITGQDMPCLWGGFQSESLQWCFGRFNTIHEKEKLFTVLWQYFRESNRQDNLPFESATTQEAYMRNVWISEKSGIPSHRWQYQEQYAKEHSGSLSSLSHEIALETEKIWKDYSASRSKRLKALGNAIVPQVAEAIMRAIKEVESMKGDDQCPET